MIKREKMLRGSKLVKSVISGYVAAALWIITRGGEKEDLCILE